MSLRNDLLKNPHFEFENNIFFEKGISRANAFEESYVKLREKENRLLPDEAVRELPTTDDGSKKSEWRMRKSSLEILTQHLRKHQPKTILELGCGNGWLASNLARNVNAEVCAVDINQTELLQGARVFSHQQNLCFVYSNIFNAALAPQKFDAVILGSSMQYFTDLKSLFMTLFALTDTIYIVDSPFYFSRDDAEGARKRSIAHFDSLGFPEMTQQYHHHTFQELEDFTYRMVYNPKSLTSLVRRRILKVPLPVFPIIAIQKDVTW